ncbi:xanthine dehydrogenase FAD-binding subunit XdhB [Pseudoflavonifractor sp. BIOML-A4]|nr:xanthine dehydrogenase FAD-binding subunit XdhB [Pseudoflavonifractor sp. BIOML-A4]
MYDIERFYRAKDVPDAVRAREADPDAMLISGGTDVLIQTREGKLAGCSLVSINQLPELMGIRIEEDGTIVIGGAATFSDITNNKALQSRIPILCWAVDQVGSPQIRNVGTIGGNVSNGVTSADSASSLFALNAVVELTGPDGVRRLPIADYYAGPGKTVRQHSEILTAIRIARADYENYGGHYIKYGKREAMEIATLGCAVCVKLTEDKRRVDDLRVAFGVAAPIPMRCHETESKAKGMALDADLLDAVSQGVLAEVKPRDSWRASRAFRLQLVSELSRRALSRAITFAGGEIHA